MTRGQWPPWGLVRPQPQQGRQGPGAPRRPKLPGRAPCWLPRPSSLPAGTLGPRGWGLRPRPCPRSALQPPQLPPGGPPEGQRGFHIFGLWARKDVLPRLLL